MIKKSSYSNYWLWKIDVIPARTTEFEIYLYSREFENNVWYLLYIHCTVNQLIIYGATVPDYTPLEALFLPTDQHWSPLYNIVLITDQHCISLYPTVQCNCTWLYPLVQHCTYPMNSPPTHCRPQYMDLTNTIWYFYPLYLCFYEL